MTRWLLLVSLFSSGALALYENCDFYQELDPLKPYYIYSPNYPNSYLPGSSCRWFAVSPPGYQVYLVCESMNLPQNTKCSSDRIAVSPTGDIDLKDASNYCGTGGFTAISVNNRMNIALMTSIWSRGGSFLCNVGTQKAPPSIGDETSEPGGCDCGWKNPVRIVGGRETGVNEFPMMAALIDGQNRELFCGATIISRSFALTAAHCLINKKPRAIGLLVGEHDTSRGNDTSAAKLLRIDGFRSHPDYNSVSQVNDIAVVHTETPIDFGIKIGPACLPFVNSKQNFAKEYVVGLGWGTTDFGGLPSKTLQKVDLKVQTTAQCQKAYGDMVSNKQICTYEKDKDACQSDSGGPILWEDPLSHSIKLLGIVSYGIQCATENPGVNTRVTEYLSWIVENADDDYCVK